MTLLRQGIFSPSHLRHRSARSRVAWPRLDPHVSMLGFTLLELMIVVTIILILLAIGGGRYEKSVVRAKEAALKQDLSVMRRSIEQYTIDKQQAPQSLDDLVSAGYLREIPIDPITRQKDWHTDTEDVALSPDQTSFGITDVHSSSDQISPFENTPYSSW